MSGQIPNFPRRSTSGFQKLVNGFFQQEGLPFSGVITASKIEEIFRMHDGLFGVGMIYSTATVLWAFLRQVLQDGKMAEKGSQPIVFGTAASAQWNR